MKLKLPPLLKMPRMKMPRMRFPQKRVTRLQANARRIAQPIIEDDEDDEPTTRLSSAFIVVLALHVVAVGGIYAFNSIKAHKKAKEVPTVADAAKSPVKKAAASETEERVPAAVARTVASAPASAPAATNRAASLAPSSTSSAKAVHSRPSDSAMRPAAFFAVDATGQNEPTAQRDAAAAAKSAPAKPATPADAKKAEFLLRKSDESFVKNAVKPAAAAPAAATASAKTYTVAKGDNPVAIARKLGVSYSELVKLNKIDDPKKLKIGQVLKVPAK